jgi:hypothetical protein
MTIMNHLIRESICFLAPPNNFKVKLKKGIITASILITLK